MDLFNQTLNGFSAHLAVSFNPDIFESNIINISLLLGGILYLGSSALSESLSERQEKIIGAIQEAEERLKHYTSLKQWESLLKSEKVRVISTQYSDIEDDINSLELEVRKNLGIKVILFFLVLGTFIYFAKNKLWREVD